MDQSIATDNVAYRIRRLRAERDWSAQQLADRCQDVLSRSTIAKIESGVRQAVTVEEIGVLARAFGVAPLELMVPPSAFESLVDAMHELRRSALVSTAKLAQLAHVPHDVLSGFLAGDSVPDWPIVHAVVVALGGDLTEFEPMWRRAFEAQHQPADEAAEPTAAPPHVPSSAPPTVFVSYAHDSPAHEDQVRQLATLLTAQGIAVDLDQWAGSLRRDWTVWALEGMSKADAVIVVASPAYRRAAEGSSPGSHSTRFEAALLRDFLYTDRAHWTRKILPVVLPGGGRDDIPLFLLPFSASHYPVDEFTPAGIGELVGVIRRWHEPELDFGKALRQARRQAGMTIDAMARHLDVSPGYLARVENGFVPASRPLRRRFATEFGWHGEPASRDRTSVVVVDRHPVVLAGVRAWCEAASPPVDVTTTTHIGDAWSGPATSSDVMVFDPDLDGSGPDYRVLRRFVDAGWQVIVYTGREDRGTALNCLAAGAATYLTKVEGEAHLLPAIRAVAMNVPYLSPSLTNLVGAEHQPKRPTLSADERNTIQAWFRSSSSQDAARQLGVPVDELRTRLDQIRQRYAAVHREAPTKTSLLVHAIEDGLVTSEDL